MLGFVIYGLITPVINSEISAYLYENLVLSRELLAKTTISLIGGTAIILIEHDSKSKLLNIDRLTMNLLTEKKLFIEMYPKRRVLYPLFLFAHCFFCPTLVEDCNLEIIRGQVFV